MRFEELNISQNIKKALEELNYKVASEIQEKTIPLILEGKDVIGQSQTGTGKTASFLIPLLQQLDKKNKSVQAIVLCPTRELALQVAEEARKFLKYVEGIKTVAIYGGESIEKQIRELKSGVQLVIGTPGRVMDHMRRRTLKLGATRFVVLDEADEMLNMGFEEDIKTILEDIPSRQTLLFSATMPRKILDLTKKYQQNPEYIKIASKELVVSNIKQIYFETNEKVKLEILNRLIVINNIKYCVIFCNTKRKVEEITYSLKSKGFLVDCLHGDMKQIHRDKVMKKFKQKEINLLIATDVAARGIDVENLDCVFNYDLPQDEEYYVHRIGRTGRNGKNGVAYSFIANSDRIKLKNIERYARTKLKQEQVPTNKELDIINSKKRIEEIDNVVDNIDNKENEVIEKLCEKYSAKQVATALYELLYPSVDETINIDEEPYTKEFKRKNKDMTKVFMNIGRKDKVSLKDIISCISNKTALSGKDIGKINILDKYSFVELPNLHVNNVIESMNTSKIKGKNVCMEFAKNV